MQLGAASWVGQGSISRPASSRRTRKNPGVYKFLLKRTMHKCYGRILKDSISFQIYNRYRECTSLLASASKKNFEEKNFFLTTMHLYPICEGVGQVPGTGWQHL